MEWSLEQSINVWFQHMLVTTITFINNSVWCTLLIHILNEKLSHISDGKQEYIPFSYEWYLSMFLRGMWELLKFNSQLRSYEAVPH